MKNLVIIIGTVILGTIIVNTMILGDGNSLKTAASGIVEKGNAAIMENLTFGNIVTDIIAEGNKCKVKSNEQYTLKINGVEYEIEKGINEFEIK